MPHNLTLVDLLKKWSAQKQATPAQIVPIPGTTQMPHLLETSGAAAVRFTSAELAELNAAVSAIEVRGARMPEQVPLFSGVEAPLRGQ